jgi:hypothetical protein
MTAHWSDALLPLRPCAEAVVWCRTQPDAETAWAACERPDWLFWLLGRTGAERRLLVLAACDCAEPALVHVPAGEDRPRLAIETARAWARGEATIEEVRRARQAAAAAYAAAYAAAAAAAYAADAAAAAAYAAASAVAAYAAAAAAAAAAAYADARRASRLRSCEAIRRHFPSPPVLEAA